MIPRASVRTTTDGAWCDRASLGVVMAKPRRSAEADHRALPGAVEGGLKSRRRQTHDGVPGSVADRRDGTLARPAGINDGETHSS